MYRLKMESKHQSTAYRWYTDPQKAHLVAIAIIRNGDYDRVTIENLKTRSVEKIYIRK